MKLSDSDLKNLVKIAGILLSTGSSLYLSWKGRAKWEPSEIDVPQLPQRMVFLLNAVFVGWLLIEPQWTQDPARRRLLMFLLASLCILAALFYLYLTATSVFRVRVNGKTTRVIAGFRLLPQARAELKRLGSTYTIQRYLTRVRSDPDRLWSKHSRAAMKVLFVACYILLSVAGTATIASLAMTFANPQTTKSGPAPRNPKPSPPKVANPADRKPDTALENEAPPPSSAPVVPGHSSTDF